MRAKLLQELEAHVAKATGGKCEIVENDREDPLAEGWRYQMTITIRTGNALMSALASTAINVARNLNERLQKAEAAGVAIEGRLTRSEDMGIFLHVTKHDGGKAGLRLDGTMLENWAKEQLGP
ncbi:MAG TPA: hypothetical protein VK178_07120 [Opitutaceae bacterium]|nr:hypothetical protein [Opitutaceae bacterium]